MARCHSRRNNNRWHFKFATLLWEHMVRLFVTGTNACKDHNGGCSQLCLPTPGTRVCKCTDGYKLAADGQTCDGK